MPAGGQQVAQVFQALKLSEAGAVAVPGLGFGDEGDGSVGGAGAGAAGQGQDVDLVAGLVLAAGDDGPSGSADLQTRLVARVMAYLLGRDDFEVGPEDPGFDGAGPEPVVERLDDRCQPGLSWAR